MRGFILAASLMASTAGFAHEAIGPNGGKLVDAGDMHVELVTKGKQVVVFVTDARETPVPAAAYKGLAVLIIDGKPQRIPLAPAGDNRLSGEAPIDLPAWPKGAVQLQLPAGGSVQGRFP